MAGGRQRERWQHTSQVLAMLAEPNRDRKKRTTPYTADDFDPFADKGRKKKPIGKVKGDIQDLKLLIGRIPGD